MNLFKTIHKQDHLTQIIYINILVFIIIHIFGIIYFFSGLGTNLESQLILLNNLSVSSNINTLIYKPWTIITHMFVHVDLLHALINLCYLYFGGKILTSYLNNKNVLYIYMMGGITGALLYILSFNTFPVFEDIKTHSMAFGASASALAVLFATATYVPNFPVNVIFFKDVKLKYIVMIIIIISILSIPHNNAGGHIAHIGGAFYGWLYIYMRKKGIKMEYRLTRIFGLSAVKKTKNRIENDYEYNARKKKEKDNIDAILDKISRSGYDSLSENEKKTLSNQK